MFDKTKDKTNEKAKETTGVSTNRIIEGTHIQGDINTKTDFRLDGTLIGNYTSTGKLVIGASGEVNGTITCVNLDIEGKFTGRLQVKELLVVKSKAHIEGEVQTGRLSVEPGAFFEASCVMKAKTEKKE